MTMQVSKGEFDRRVKLLEQKVRDSSNGLISRLQAETEAFIEKLRNTELNIENLENEVAGTEANLDNLVTSFDNYKANMLRIDSAFDANGQFDGSRIMPLSVETAALSVGQRSQQLTLSGIKFEVKNYDVNGSNFNESSPEVWESGRGKLTYTSGSLFHYGFGTEADGPKLYSISSGNKIMTSTDAYYIYVKLPKTNNSTATIDIDTRQITVEGKSGSTIVDNNNYYIQLGYISSEMQSANGIFKNTRKVDMTYGTTTINGRLITTGRIEGNNVALDLDTGEIKGKITFVPGQDYSAISSALNMSQYATTSSVNEVNGQKTVSETIYMSSGATTKPNINTIPSLPSDRVTEPTTTWESWGWQRNWTTQICSGANWYYTCIQTYKLNSSGVYISGSTKYSKIEYSDNISTSAAAIQGTTTVDGGLILTRKIICGSASGTSAISGVGNYAFWAGASEPSSAKAYIKHNGDSYFKSVIIDNNNFKLKNEEITSIDSIAKLNIGNASCGSTENYRLKFVINETPDFNKYTYYCRVKYKYRVAEGQSIQTTSQTYPIIQQNQILQSSYIVEQIENQASIRYRKAASGMTIYTNGFTLENSYTYSGIFHLSIYYLFSIQHQGSDNGIKSGSVTLTEF